MSWLLGSLVVLGFALTCGFAWYERSHPSARVLALIATLAALAALGRVAFAPLPQIKPTTDIVLLTGYVLGGAPGFAVGAVAAVASNVFFGQGPWTPWQMGAWGVVGLMGAGLGRVWGPDPGRMRLAAGCAAAALVYGSIMNFSLWATFSGDHTFEKLVFFASTSLPFDVAHAIGNVLFCVAFGPVLVAALRRYRTRFEVTWAPAPAVAAAALAAVVLAGALTAAPDARAAVPRASVDYLLKAQNADGGFPGVPGQRSTGLHTGWAGLGLAAAGRNPADVSRGRSNVLAYVSSHAGELDDLGGLERTVLLFAAAGRPAQIGSRDLVAELAGKRRADGSFAGRVNTTAFAVLALRAAGRSPGDRSVKTAGRWIARQANSDGGFNFAGRGGPSGVDDTGAALQGLVAAGRAKTATVSHAASFLVRRQNPDGGFPLTPGAASNAQSTAWAVQGLLAAGRDPDTVRRNGSRDPLAYLSSLVGSDGAVRYSRLSRQTPVWVTAQALTALARKPFPLAAAPRRRRRAARPATGTPAKPPPSASTAPIVRAAPAPKPRAAPKRVAARRPAVRATWAPQRAAARLAAYRTGLALSLVARLAS
jgi:energy-coupling factor transport system substrate-specific component